MISKLHIKNFQSHKDTEINFHPRINVLHGPSDCGKSGVLRSIKAVIEREKFYVTTGKKDGEIQLDFDDFSLQRKCTFVDLKKCPECGEKLNGTEQQCKCGEVLSAKPATDSFSDGKEVYAKFGVTLPDFILQKTRMYPIKFVDVEENLQIFNQHDDMFFIGKSYSGGLRNKIIASLFPESDKIDFLIKNLNSRSLNTKGRIEIIEEQIVSDTDKLKKGKDAYDNIKRLSLEIESLEFILQGFREEQMSLETIQSKLQKTSKVEYFTKKADKIAPFISILLQRSCDLSLLNTNSNRLESLQGDIGNPIDFTIQQFDISMFDVTETQQKESKLIYFKNVLKKKIDFLVLPMDIVRTIDCTILVSMYEDKLELDLTKEAINCKNELIERALSDCGTATIAVMEKREEFKTFLCNDAICPIIKDKYCDTCKKTLAGESK